MTTTLSHRDLARLAALWLLQRRWAYLAGFEVALADGNADAIAVSKPRDPEVEELVRLELDAWGAAGEEGPRPKAPAGWRHASLYHWRPTPESAKGVVGLVEVKRTRADLLQDLRRRKMLKYQPQATNLWLAGTEEALRGRDSTVLEDLAARGLPPSWGVLLLPTEGDPARLSPGLVWALRGSRRTRVALPGELRLRAYQVGRSLSYRALRGDV